MGQGANYAMVSLEDWKVLKSIYAHYIIYNSEAETFIFVFYLPR